MIKKSIKYQNEAAFLSHVITIIIGWPKRSFTVIGFCSSKQKTSV
jgi:hypothetical protein